MSRLVKRKIFSKIISGGQTGVDRAALDVAMELGLEAGGWCPRGRRAEDGRDPRLLSAAGNRGLEISGADPKECPGERRDLDFDPG